MIRARVRAITALILGWTTLASHAAESIPRPEHPTPDAVREHWKNLNGPWQFRFDPKDEGREAKWFEPGAPGFDRTITVPFGWESALSGIHRHDDRGIGWYRRSFDVPGDFPAGEHVWLHFGAVDWRADVWINGRHVAEHEGGYSPFSADVTEAITRDKPNVVVVRAIDTTDPGLPTGKQVGWYTPTSGIWQTVWLESRPRVHIDRFTIKTEIDPARVLFQVDVANLGRDFSYTVTVRSDDATVEPASYTVSAKDSTISSKSATKTPVVVRHTARGIEFELPVTIREPRLWTPESPHLYEVKLELEAANAGGVKQRDTVSTYFGLRTVGRGRYGDSPFERLLLNGKPIYLRAALDQSFNPEGIYTAPSDAFLKRDLELAKSFGLNALRIHIKPDEPRRLYWADRLGVLILEDMPNTWRQNPRARKAWEATMREVVARDRNHPAIFAWVAFNETWGLGSPPEYKADRDTQAWVGRMVGSIRRLDPTRLVEDNSPCNYDHVENTDLNSWHFYIDDHESARRHIDEVVDQTRPGSGFNYCPNLKQATAPLINSEYGSISAGSGDRDISWGFRDLTTLLRRQAKIQGYVYTELDDIEWEHNGFVNYDRTPKESGYGAFVDGMTVADLQGADFIGYDGPPAIVAEPGEEITVPVFVSHYSDRTEPPIFTWTLKQVFGFGATQVVTDRSEEPISWKAYGVTELKPVKVRVASSPCVGAIGLMLTDRQGRRIAANFVNVVVKAAEPRVGRANGEKNAAIVRFAPGEFSRRRWSGPVTNPPGKVTGQGSGFFEYRLMLPEAVAKARPKSLSLWAELASRAGRAKVDMAERRNAQDYPQTDARKWPSTVRFTVNGHELGRHDLPDDPADARGVLSHLARYDHGSHGELVALGGDLPESVRAEIASGKPLVLRLSVPDDAEHPGGLAIFGAGAGAYPSDPAILIRTESPLPSGLGGDPNASAAIDTAASRKLALVTAGDSPGAPTSWAFTTTDPGEGWTRPDFDDRAWSRGKPGFGTPNTPAVRVGTRWDTRTIWLRTAVELPKIGPDDDVTLHLFHDEDVDIFVNGKPLYHARGYLTSYRDIVLDDAQKSLLRSGVNTLCVSCRQTGGGQGIDLGLTLDRAE